MKYACIKHRNSELYELHVSSWLPGATENCHHPQKDRMVLLMISTASRISSSLITSGGANLMMSPWVGLARSPLSRSRRHTFQASQSSKEKPSRVCWSMIRSLQGWGSLSKTEFPVPTQERQLWVTSLLLALTLKNEVTFQQWFEWYDQIWFLLGFCPSKKTC